MAERDITVGMIEGSYLSWFADLDMGATITETWRSDRAQSSIRRFTIGESPGQRSIVVKENLLAEHPVERPRLGLRSGFEHKHRLESAALEATATALAARPEDSTLGALRVLATTDRGLVIEAVDALDLGQQLRRTHGFRTEASVQRAGHWLRLFHSPEVSQLADPDHTLPTVRHDAATVCESFADYRAFLRDELDEDHNDLGRALDTLVSALAADIEHHPLRVGLGHGDFAPRNVFIESDGRVTVIDPLGCQRCPVEEDLAYFAVSLRRGALVPWIKPLSSHRAERLERAMLDGYGLDPADRFRYEAFAVLVTLDVWAADRVRGPVSEGAARRLLRSGLPQISQLLADRLKRAAIALERASDGKRSQ